MLIFSFYLFRVLKEIKARLVRGVFQACQEPQDLQGTQGRSLVPLNFGVLHKTSPVAT